MKILNSKILFTTLLISGGLAAILLIGQIWLSSLEWDVLMKAAITIVIVGALSGFLIAIDYDIPASKGKYMLGLVVFLALLMGGLIISQIWWYVLAWGVFAKTLGTIFILFILVSFILAVKEDFGTNKKLKDDHYLD